MNNVVPLRKSALLGGGSGRAYEAGSRSSVELSGWNPPRISADTAIIEDYGLTDARVRDLARSSPTMAAMLKRKVDNILGPNVKLQMQVDYETLGISPDAGRELSKAIEREWRLYTRDPAKNCDAGRRLNFGAMARVLYRHWQIEGRCTVVPMWLPRRGGRYGTAFRMLDPLRLSNPNGRPNAYNLRNGIEIDDNAAPVAYWIRNSNPGDFLIADSTKQFTWTRIPAVTSWGRKRFIHGFDQTEAEQTQGISAYAPGVKRIRMLDTRSDLELQRAGINASFAAFIKSALPSDAIFKALTEAPDGSDDTGMEALEAWSIFQEAFYEQRNYMLNGARLGHLLPGEEFQTVNPQGPGADFEASQRVWQRDIAALGGVTYEQLTYDYSNVNYSSARAASGEVKKGDNADLEIFADATLTPMVDCWLEEVFGTGRVKVPAGAPSYIEARAAYCQIQWTSPGTPAIDPLKEAKAGETLLASGQYTLLDYLAEDGRDPEEHFAQLAIEKALAAKYGIPWPPTPLPATSNGGEAPEGTDVAPEPGDGSDPAKGKP